MILRDPNEFSHSKGINHVVMGLSYNGKFYSSHNFCLDDEERRR